MRLSHFSRLFPAFALLLCLSLPALAALTFEEAAKLLPNKVGDARAAGAPSRPPAGVFEHLKPSDIAALSTATRTYVVPSGEKFGVQLITLQSDAAAYAFVMNEQRERLRAVKDQVVKLDLGGTAAFSSGGQIYLAKGATVVILSGTPDSAEKEAA
ncbi:MAG: hypothetical protein QOD32_849, partial [Pyrinomonadaceae bacterium]|nr:hypothetical protein [Pyrinomonadaceae bacterium]